jgi:hypothetical protein
MLGDRISRPEHTFCNIISEQNDARNYKCLTFNFPTRLYSDNHSMMYCFLVCSFKKFSNSTWFLAISFYICIIPLVLFSMRFLRDLLSIPFGCVLFPFRFESVFFFLCIRTMLRFKLHFFWNSRWQIVLSVIIDKYVEEPAKISC